MIRIICIGNRYLDLDASGPMVFDYLADEKVPEHIEVIDGGLAGLNLLGLVDGARRVVFVDAVSGYGDDVVVLGPEDLPLPEKVYDHAAGLPYLIHVLHDVCNEVPPEIFLVGIEGKPGAYTVARAARLCVEIARDGMSASGASVSMRRNQ